MLKKFKKNNKILQDYANKIIPGLSGLLGKRPEMYLPGGKWPTYYSKAKGLCIWDLQGKKYLDFTPVAVGSCVLGYSDNEINRISEIDSKYRSDVDESFLNSRLKTDKAIFSVLINKNSNYKVSTGDIVIIENIVDYVEIIGGIKKPGTYKYNSEFDINNYITQAGNFSQSAKNKNIYIINQENGVRNKVNISYVPQAGDVIFIEEKVGFKSWERFSESIKLAGTLSTMSLVIYNIWDKMSDD